MGGGGSNTSTQLTVPMNPAIEAFINQTIPYLQQTQAAGPLEQFAQPQVREVAGLSPLQQFASSLIPQVAVTPGQTNMAGQVLGYDPTTGQSTNTVGQSNLPSILQQMQSLVGGNIGESPATVAGMNAFRSLVQPGIENNLATMGLGRSGAGAQLLSQAETQAAAPLIQQEIQNRMGMVPQMTSLANALSGIGAQERSGLTTASGLAMTQGGTEREIAQSALDAPLQDFLRRQSLASGVTTLGGVPYTQPTQQTTTTAKPSFFGK